MGYSPLTFESAPPEARKQHLLEAHKLLRSAIVHRNQITPAINDTGAIDLETTMRIEHLYSDYGLQGFAERWGPLFGASPQSPAVLTPEAFLQSLYPKGTHLLFSYGNSQKDDDGEPSFPDGVDDAGWPVYQPKWKDPLFPLAIPCEDLLPPGFQLFWPHPFSHQTKEPVERAKVLEHENLVTRWRYLWVPIGDHYEADWMLEQVLSGATAPTAIFVRLDEYGSEEPCLLMPCDHSSYKAAKRAVLKALPEEVSDETEDWNDDLLTDLVPLPWRQDDYRLVYFNPPTPAK